MKDFEYDEKENRYRCPAGKELSYQGHVKLNRNSGEKYQAKSSDCKDCALRQRRVAGRGGKSPKRTLYIADRSGEENLCGEMRNKIDEPKYRALYGRRMQIIEPCFSDIRYCKGMDRFSLRTKIKVNIQWLLYCIVHNIGKCMPGKLAESGG
ncbi:MAG: transposase [Spirochaetaceae bacterium]|nr:transposase [Spirochaetaceae bacterium]